jgi:hypothetical protein
MSSVFHYAHPPLRPPNELAEGGLFSEKKEKFPILGVSFGGEGPLSEPLAVLNKVSPLSHDILRNSMVTG